MPSEQAMKAALKVKDLAMDYFGYATATGDTNEVYQKFPVTGVAGEIDRHFPAEDAGMVGKLREALESLPFPERVPQWGIPDWQMAVEKAKEQARTALAEEEVMADNEQIRQQNEINRATGQGHDATKREVEKLTERVAELEDQEKQYEARLEETAYSVSVWQRAFEDLESFTNDMLDNPGDRLYHAADKTWWRRKGLCLKSADAPPGVEPVACSMPPTTPEEANDILASVGLPPQQPLWSDAPDLGPPAGSMQTDADTPRPTVTVPQQPGSSHTAMNAERAWCCPRCHGKSYIIVNGVEVCGVCQPTGEPGEVMPPPTTPEEANDILASVGLLPQRLSPPEIARRIVAPWTVYGNVRIDGEVIERAIIAVIEQERFASQQRFIIQAQRWEKVAVGWRTQQAVEEKRIRHLEKAQDQLVEEYEGLIREAAVATRNGVAAQARIEELQDDLKLQRQANKFNHDEHQQEKAELERRLAAIKEVCDECKVEIEGFANLLSPAPCGHRQADWVSLVSPDRRDLDSGEYCLRCAEVTQARSEALEEAVKSLHDAWMPGRSEGQEQALADAILKEGEDE